MTHDEAEIPLSEPMRRAWLSSEERSVVYRKGDVVVRESGSWAASVHSLLRHLENAASQLRQTSSGLVLLTTDVRR